MMTCKRAENGIEYNEDCLNKFVSMWIGSHKGLTIPLKRFLVANMLRHWDETILLIQKEPKGVFSGEKYKRHIFIHKVIEICNHLNITEETFCLGSEMLDIVL